MEWVDSGGKRFEMFDQLATALETFLLDHVLADGPEISAAESATRFAEVLPDVLGKCDEPIYNVPFVAEAYAFVHLLERYRRISRVLDILLKAGVLPMRDSGIDVLDVGVGPGPALYATNDFYELLAQYAEVHGIAGLKTPQPKLHSIESSWGMVRVMYWISKLSGRSGPLDRSLASFTGIDFEQMRLHSRDAAIRALDLENITWTAISHLPNWQDEWRFNFGIFSYFLTHEVMVEGQTRELESLFQSMRAGGVVVVLGAVAGKYRRIYKGVCKIADSELMKGIERKHARIPCSYTDRYAARIKAVYQKVWRRLEGNALNLDAVKPQLPPDLWDPAVPLTGPPAFGLRVFRRINITPGRGSWHKRKAAKLRRAERRR